MSRAPAQPEMSSASARCAELARRYHDVRALTATLAAPLGSEDCQAQSMPDASPVKWHLAHTTWFFETFVLGRFEPAYRPVHPQYRVLFNSYYAGVGPAHPRPERGLLTRPSLEEVREYRRLVDARIGDWLRAGPAADALDVLELGLEHEGQHQELILTDVKHLLSRNPLRPAYHPAPSAPPGPPAPALAWRHFPAGFAAVGAPAEGFAFDHERPRHRVWLEDFAIATRLVTNREYGQFIADGGYARAELWLSDGWDLRQRENWQAPLYWESAQAGDGVFTLAGMQRLDPDEPVCHVSYYEADAYARWCHARLPTEAEWERAAQEVPPADETCNVLERGRHHPAPAGAAPLAQFLGDAWEWTASAFLPYPGFVPWAGALGEYNGKFMANQMVLRGGSCATPARQGRADYRNFFAPHARWQFSGIRLAR